DVEAAEAVGHGLDELLTRLGRGHVRLERLGVTAGRAQLGHHLVRRARRRGVVDGHPVAERAEERGGLPPYAPARSSHQRRAAAFLRHRVSTSSRLSGSVTEATTTPGNVRLIRFVSTSPEPNSRNAASPPAAACSQLTVSTQRTLPVTCAVSSSGAVSGEGNGRAVTLFTTGNRGGAKRTSARSAASRLAAGAIRLQWNGAETLSGMARAPASFSAAEAASTAAASPEITVWPGAL